MSKTDTPNDLSGTLLVAMPGMRDARFEHAVVFLCAHSDEGAMGLIINRPVPDIVLGDLLDQLEINRGSGNAAAAIFFGGPVEGGRGFVLHSRDYAGAEATLPVNPAFGLTATRDILADIAKGAGPASALTALGYAGWGPGQLETEIQENAWLTVDADLGLVFDPDVTGKWAKALAKLGIDPSMLSAEGGRA